MEWTRYTPSAPVPRNPGYPEARSRASEERLIDRTLQGRPDAFGDLVLPYLTYLNRLARMRLRSDFEAEDVVQQTVLKAFSQLQQFRGEASFKTWLSAIIFNEVSHLRRGNAVAPIRSLHEGRAANLVDPSSWPDVKFQQGQDVEQLHKALVRLPEKYRLMIQMRDLHELSIAETARSLSLSIAAVKTRHHRARKLLARSLGRAKTPKRTGI